MSAAHEDQAARSAFGEITTEPRRIDSRIRPKARPAITDERRESQSPIPADFVVPTDLRAPHDEHAVPTAISEINNVEYEVASRVIARLAHCERHDAEFLTDQLLPLGDSAIQTLAQHFPGRLWVTREQVRLEMPAADDISPIAYALVRFGGRAAPAVVELLSSPRRDVRFFATLLCRDIVDSRIVLPLAALALEDDHDCRRAALYILSRYKQTSDFDNAMLRFRRVAADVDADETARKRSISALAQLREGRCVALLVDLLHSEAPAIRKAARVALRVLTAHDFGFGRSAWLGWLQTHAGKDRVLWLIAALGDHRTDIRQLAADELWRATSKFPPPPTGDDTHNAYLHLQRTYRTWWATEGQLSAY